MRSNRSYGAPGRFYTDICSIGSAREADQWNLCPIRVGPPCDCCGDAQGAAAWEALWIHFLPALGISTTTGNSLGSCRTEPASGSVERQPPPGPDQPMTWSRRDSG